MVTAKSSDSPFDLTNCSFPPTGEALRYFPADDRMLKTSALPPPPLPAWISSGDTVQRLAGQGKKTDGKLEALASFPSAKRRSSRYHPLGEP